MTPAIPPIERIEFFDLQRVDAADLNALESRNTALRHLHNRSMHGWGIASGLDFLAAAGERKVSVTPGYAIDSQGREIILETLHDQPIPPVAGIPDGAERKEDTRYLTIRYAHDKELTPTEFRDGVCRARGAVRLPEEPIFAWRTANDLDPGTELILGQIWIKDCKISRAPSLAARRDARQDRQPYLAAGQSPRTGTSWTFFGPTGKPTGVQATIDTSSARFALIPRYFARLAGKRTLSQPAGNTRGQLFDGFTYILDPAAAQFIFQVFLPRDLPGGNFIINPDTAIAAAGFLAKLNTDLNWHVVWMGLEGEQ
jgi:hypothetical protein